MFNKRKKVKTNSNDLVVGGSFPGCKIHVINAKEFIPEYAPIMSVIIFYRSTYNHVSVMIKDFTFSFKRDSVTELFALPIEKDKNGWFLSYKNIKLKCIPYEEFDPEKITAETRTILKKVDKQIFVVFINDLFLC